MTSLRVTSQRAVWAGDVTSALQLQLATRNITLQITTAAKSPPPPPAATPLPIFRRIPEIQVVQAASGAVQSRDEKTPAEVADSWTKSMIEGGKLC